MSTGIGALLEAEICELCALESWACVCSPIAREHRPTDAELQQARTERLTRAEREGQP